MVIKESGIGATLLGAILAIAQISPEYVTRGILQDSWSWLPQLGTAGRTVVLYTYIGHAIGFLVSVTSVFALGYLVGTRLNLRAHYRKFVATLAIGGGIGYGGVLLVIIAPGLVSGDIAIQDGTSIITLVVMGKILAVSIQFAVIGFAGSTFTSLIVGGTSDQNVAEPSKSKVGSK